ncbi:hypothetical protein [Bdellovibrio reynosensis]|uniref:Lipoprotein n=1 Tax=Bdellovibrio reynosensis TaxID=2835041 RepID=A0ABY4C8M0_9BACT|nr:hypothetical protein [Bdellovibrio reynosensis]UOF01074.1 hypothetical protein MNR06_15340 [Bdellovibrio reynosensis]
MSKRDVRNFNILGIFLFMVGCSDAAPTVALLRSLEGFDFNETSIVTSNLSAVPLSAKCSSYVGKIEMSFDDGVTWINPGAHDVSAKSECANGSFTMNISNSSSPLNAMTIGNGQLIKIKFRAMPKVGSWIYRSVSLKYSASTVIRQELLAGSQIQSGTNMILRGRARAQSQFTASGGGFAITGRIKQ